MDFVETTYEAKSQADQIRLFNLWAKKYKTDFFNDPELNQILEYGLASGVSVKANLVFFNELWQEVRARYCEEEGEQILRPKLFWQTCGDCDDQYIFFCALFLALGFPKEHIFTVQVKQFSDDAHYCHIFAALEISPGNLFSFDALPHSLFGIVDYKDDQMRIDKFT